MADGRHAQRADEAARLAEEQARADAALEAVEAAKAERVRTIAQNEVGMGSMERELQRSREQEVERAKAELAREEEAKAERKAERARRKAEGADAAVAQREAARAAGVRNNAWTRSKAGLVTQEAQLRQRLNAAKLVVAAPPPLDVAALREVLLTMDTETRDARALAETKADKKVVVYRHELDEWIDRRCMILLQPVIDDLKAYKERTDPRIQALEDEMPPLKARVTECEAQLKQHKTKIGNLSARLLKAETALIEKAEQTEVNALAEATRRFMQKTGKTLTAHEGTMGVMKETTESNRAALQQQVSANLDETRAIPATIPPLEQFNNWVKKNEALQTKQMKLFERMNMLKKAYYASDASLPLKTQLELFMKEDVPE
eukprot:COSAG06_NODE_431_length_15859_cov_19.762500_5_plen_377_part_00